MHNNVICCIIVFAVLSFVLSFISIIFLYIGMLLKEQTIDWIVSNVYALTFYSVLVISQ